MRTLGDRPHEQTALTHLGNIHALCHMPMFAIHCFQDAIAIAESLDDYENQADLHDKLAYLSLQQRHWQQSISHYQKALTIAQQLEDLALQSKSWNNIGGIYLTLEQFSPASECFQRVINLRQQQDDLSGEAKAWVILGKTLKQADQLEGSLKAFQQARKVFETLGDANLVARCDAVLKIFENN